MRNFKKIGWIEEMQDQSDEKWVKGLYDAGCVFLLFGCLSLTSSKENKIVDNLRQEILKLPY